MPECSIDTIHANTSHLSGFLEGVSVEGHVNPGVVADTIYSSERTGWFSLGGSGGGFAKY